MKPNPTINTLTAVFEVCDQLDTVRRLKQERANEVAKQNKTKPKTVASWTQKDVLDTLGKGSYETLNPLIKLWHQRQDLRENAEVVPTTVVEAMVRSVQDHYKKLTLEAKEKMVTFEKTFGDTLDDLNLQNEQLAEKIKTLDEECKAHKIETMSANARTASLRQLLATSEANEKHLSEENTGLKQQIDRLTAKVEALETQSAERSSVFQEQAITLAERTQERDALTEQRNTLATRLDETTARLSEKKEAVIALELHNQGLSRDLEACEMAKQQASQILAALEQERSDLKEALATQKGALSIIKEQVDQLKPIMRHCDNG